VKKGREGVGLATHVWQKGKKKNSILEEGVRGIWGWQQVVPGPRGSGPDYKPHRKKVFPLSIGSFFKKKKRTEVPLKGTKPRGVGEGRNRRFLQKTH